MSGRDPNPGPECSCIPYGSTKTEGATTTVSIRFGPGCTLCAACICVPISMLSTVEDKWCGYVKKNGNCPFCYAVEEPIILPISQEQLEEQRRRREHIEEEQVQVPCGQYGAATDPCDCYANMVYDAGIKAEANMGIARKKGRALIKSLRRLRSVKK